MNTVQRRPARDRSRLLPMALVATVVLVGAACGQIPTSSPGPEATAALSLPASTAATSSASPVAALVAPTPETARAARVAEVPCPTTFGMPDETAAPIPSTMTATLTSEVAAQVTFYGNGTLTLLGPKGWRCEAAVGVDGSARMTITPPGQAAASGSFAPDDQAVTAYTGGACVGCIAAMACGLFPEAWNLFAQPGSSCPTTLPAREQVTRPGPRSAVFEDPPSVEGTGEPSGGRYRAIGLLVYDPGSAAGGGGLTVPSALKVTCTLPDAMAQICDEIIEGAGTS